MNQEGQIGIFGQKLQNDQFGLSGQNDGND